MPEKIELVLEVMNNRGFVAIIKPKSGFISIPASFGYDDGDKVKLIIEPVKPQKQ